MRIFSLMKNILTHHFLLILFATIFSILYQGYYFGENNGSFYIPYLKSLYNPALYPNDLLVTTWNQVYIGSLWKTIASIMHVVPLEPLLLILHVIFRFLFYIAIYYLSLQIFRNQKVAYLSVVLWFIPKPSLGFEILYNEFVQSGVVLPLLLFAILFFLKNRYLLLFIFLGISFHIHPPMTIFIIASIFLYFLYKKELKNNIIMSIVIFLIAFPVILPTILFAQGKGGYDALWLQLTRMRSPHHSFPLSWLQSVWMPFFIFLGFLLFVKKFLKVEKYNSSLKKVYFLLLSLIIVMVTGFLFSEVVSIPKVIVSVPFHISSIFAVLASLPIVYFIYEYMTSKVRWKKVFGYALFIMFFFNNFDLQIHRSQIVIIPIFLLASVIIYNVFASRDEVKKYSTSLYIFILVLTIFWLPMMFKKNVLRTDEYKTNWIDIQKWAKENTETNAMFITPIYLQGFRVHSERSIIADWKDGSGGYLSPQFLQEWWKRMEDFGLDRNNYDNSYQKNVYANLDHEKVRSLKKKYNAQYLIIEKQNYNFSLVYKNKYFYVYNVK